MNQFEKINNLKVQKQNQEFIYYFSEFSGQHIAMLELWMYSIFFTFSTVPVYLVPRLHLRYPVFCHKI